MQIFRPIPKSTVFKIKFDKLFSDCICKCKAVEKSDSGAVSSPYFPGAPSTASISHSEGHAGKGAGTDVKPEAQGGTASDPMMIGVLL